MISALTAEQVENQTASNRGIDVRTASMLDIPALAVDNRLVVLLPTVRR